LFVKQLHKLLFDGAPPLSISLFTDLVIDTHKIRPVSLRLDKLLFGDITVGGDAYIAPVVLRAKPHRRRR
jgi:hypothetical protein